MILCIFFFKSVVVSDFVTCCGSPRIGSLALLPNSNGFLLFSFRFFFLLNSDLCYYFFHNLMNCNKYMNNPLISIFSPVLVCARENPRFQAVFHFRPQSSSFAHVKKNVNVICVPTKYLGGLKTSYESDFIGICKCWFLRRGENRSTRRKTSRSNDENQQQTQPAYDTGAGSRPRATLVGGERSHHYAIPASPVRISCAAKRK